MPIIQKNIPKLTLGCLMIFSIVVAAMLLFQQSGLSKRYVEHELVRLNDLHNHPAFQVSADCCFKQLVKLKLSCMSTLRSLAKETVRCAVRDCARSKLRLLKMKFKPRNTFKTFYI